MKSAQNLLNVFREDFGGAMDALGTDTTRFLWLAYHVAELSELGIDHYDRAMVAERVRVLRGQLADYRGALKDPAAAIAALETIAILCERRAEALLRALHEQNELPPAATPSRTA